MAYLRTRITKAGSPVKRPPGTEDLPRIRDLNKQPLTEASEAVEIEEITPKELTQRDAQSYVQVEVESTKGKKYRITVPSSYAPNIPKVWEWNTRRLKAAELLATGFPISQVVLDPEVGVTSRHIIYAWLQHPEFKEHVDALVLETGFASQRERIAGLTRLTQKLFDKLLDDGDNIPVTDRSLGAIITGVMAGMKQLAQEKGEFIEMQNVQQQTNLTGTLATAHVDISQVIQSKSEEERKALELQFDNLGDSIIRQITGDK